MKDKKQYRLKRWYPSLDSCWEVEDIAYYYRNGVYWNDTRVVENGVSAKEVENNPDFWEEVKQPLFITEDGVEVFDQEDVYYVTDKLEKINSFINWFTIESIAKDTKIFKHESSADEYIWRNKRVFSYEDMMKAKHSIILTYEDIEKAAKERSRNE